MQREWDQRIFLHDILSFGKNLKIITVANKISKNLTPKNREEDFIWSAVSQIEKDKMSLNYNNLKNT